MTSIEILDRIQRSEEEKRRRSSRCEKSEGGEEGSYEGNGIELKRSIHMKNEWEERVEE